MSAIPVQIYVKSWCPYCAAARELLTRKGVPFEEIDIEASPAAAQIMVQRRGQRTVPQIFIGEQHIGGSDDLHALDAAGELDALLAPR